MEPARRILLLVLFASVLAAEPTYAVTPTANGAPSLGRPDLPAAARWVQRLAVALQRSVEKASSTGRARPAIAPRPGGPTQGVEVHPALLPHAFRLPPPDRQG